MSMATFEAAVSQRNWSMDSLTQEQIMSLIDDGETLNLSEVEFGQIVDAEADRWLAEQKRLLAPIQAEAKMLAKMRLALVGIVAMSFAGLCWFVAS
jgi:hypothetical protein